jgi:branched-subunit amino acid aminotransferase/4-amino-4-deoxychorismate lyase
MLRIEIDGRPATVQTLYPAMTSYAHFTAMQVRDRATRGLDLHLARLDAASRELFGTGVDGERVRELVRHALGSDVADASVRVVVFQPGRELSLLVSVRPPAPEPSSPASLTAVRYQRETAHVKHLGGFGQSRALLDADAAGFDEALLVGAEGVIAEGALTNVGFLEPDGQTVVWPDAPHLRGIAMQVLQREMDRAGLKWRLAPVRLDSLGAYGSAIVSNSHGVARVSRIDDHTFPAAGEAARAAERLIALYSAAPPDPI